MPKCNFILDDGQTLTSELAKITRAALYGEGRVKVLGPQNEPLQKAAIPEEGDCYLVRGDLKLAQKIGDQFCLAQSETVDALTNNPKTVVSSSFKESPGFRKATAAEVAMLEVKSVYQLPDAQLAAGSLFLGHFNYRDGYEANDAAIVANASGAFLLVGNLKTPAFIGLEVDSRLIADAAAEDVNGNGEEGDFESLF